MSACDWHEGVIAILRLLRVPDLADLVVTWVKATGVTTVVGIILFYRVIMEALVYQRLIRPIFRRK